MNIRQPLRSCILTSMASYDVCLFFHYVVEIIPSFPLLFQTNYSIQYLIHNILIHSSGTAAGSSGGGGGGGGGLHCVVLGVCKQVDNLRSAVAKNALLTLGDLFQGLGRAMDQEVALALTFVLKVAISTEVILFSSPSND